MTDHMLVHLNVVRPVGPFSVAQPEAVYFFQRMPLVFAAAKEDPGLRWHNHGARAPDGAFLTMEAAMNRPTTRTEENCHILTMAGWTDVAAMHRFAYRLDLHREGMKRLRDWVDRSEGATMVLWWARRENRVTLEEAWDRLAQLRRQGPGPEAFTLQQRFAPPAA